MKSASASPGFRIRQATPADLETLQPFAERTWITAFAHSFDDVAQAQEHIAGQLSLAALQVALQSDNIFLALNDDALVGYGQLGTPTFEGVPLLDRDLQLRRLYVEPNRHCAGVGTQLLDTAFEYARSEGAGTLWLEVWEHNHGAQRLYRRHGFETVASRRYFHKDGTPLDFDYVMRARIRAATSS